MHGRGRGRPVSLVCLRFHLTLGLGVGIGFMVGGEWSESTLTARGVLDLLCLWPALSGVGAAPYHVFIGSKRERA